MYIPCLVFLMISAGCEDDPVRTDEVPDIPDAPYVWRICNNDADHPMENIVILKYNTDDQDSLMVGDVIPEQCSNYYAGPYEGERPIDVMKYEKSGEDYLHIYLTARNATKGLPDSLGTSPSLFTQLVMGRYTYHFARDTTLIHDIRIEIELEAYH
ncbi:MAG: hypothetical protein WD097_02685 [Balneolales bacterium]